MRSGAEALAPGLPEQNFSIGFLTALVSEELIPCETELRQADWQEQATRRVLSEAGITVWSKSIDGREITAYSAAIGRMGQVDSAVETLAFMERTKPSLVVLTGIAGSLKDETIFKGDVVVGTDTHWRTQNKISSEPGPCDVYRPYNHNISGYSSDLRNVLTRWIANTYPFHDRMAPDIDQFNVHAGEIFTWDYVANGRGVVKTLTDAFPSAACVEMEAGGFFKGIDRHCQLNGNRYVERYIVRGISDYASEKDKDRTTRQKASSHAAKVAISLGEWRSQNHPSRRIEAMSGT